MGVKVKIGKPQIQVKLITTRWKWGLNIDKNWKRLGNFVNHVVLINVVLMRLWIWWEFYFFETHHIGDLAAGMRWVPALGPGEGKSGHQSQKWPALAFWFHPSCHKALGKSFYLLEPQSTFCEMGYEDLPPPYWPTNWGWLPLGPLWLLSPWLSRSRCESGHLQRYSIPGLSPMVPALAP